MQNNSILIVDDEPIVRESIQAWLTDVGYMVSITDSGEKALELIKNQDFSVLVMDIRLPGQTGIDILREVKKQRPWIKSIIITAYPSEQTTSESKQLGAIDYLIKPVAPDDLERCIKNALDTMEKEPTVTTAVQLKPAPVSYGTVIPKKSFFISQEELKSIVEGLISEIEVVGVKAKKGKYIYDKLNNFDELILDYDVTLLPPTKYLQPAKEVLFKYKVSKSSLEAAVEDTPRAIIGIHPYDLKAFELLDDVFMTTIPDIHYITRRSNTILIGVDCLHPSPKSFSPSVGTASTDTGFDLFLSKISNGYIVTVGSIQGSAILKKYTRARAPASDEIAQQTHLRNEALSRYKLSLNVPLERLPKLLEDSYDNPYWESRSEDCLSCGSCIMVCPTCYCFDVQEELSLDLEEGQHIRSWDGCMLSDFAKVATGENFRHDKASRLRHRIFRKGKYIIEKYGHVGCVGCGRCATACLAEIASPLEAFNDIAESAQISTRPVSSVIEAKIDEKTYLPHFAEILTIEELSPIEKVFEFKFQDGTSLKHRPGQFVEVLIMGIGESPISISSSPTRESTFQLAIRNVGSVTQAIHNLNVGAILGIRGPFGNGFPMENLKGKDLLLIAGGIGLFPLRSLIHYVLDRRGEFGKVTILYGARSPAERLFTDELTEWSRRHDVEFIETVDRGDAHWKGNTGVITTLIPRLKIDPKKTMAVTVGPPIMYRFVTVELKKLDLADDNIIMSLERRMKCGVGKCGHCQINGVYVCQEGPVFTLAQLRNLREAI